MGGVCWRVMEFDSKFYGYNNIWLQQCFLLRKKMEMLKHFRISDLQNFRSVLAQCIAKGIHDAEAIDVIIGNYLALSQQPGNVIPAGKRRPDNVIVCAICGKSAVILPLSQQDRTKTATHAIQCQNRPATDHPWRSGMCGHTEYIVR